jgi:hypothetical protein
MAKKESPEAAPAQIVKAPANQFPAIVPEEFQTVELSRKWFQAKAGQSPIHFLALKRSPNVRGQFESKFPQDDSPLHVYACEVYEQITPEMNVLFMNKEPCAAKPGEIFYMIEPKRLALFLQSAIQSQFIVRVQAIAKKPVKSRRFGEVMSWEYDAQVRPRYVETTVDLGMLMLPAPEAVADYEEG